MMPTRVYSPELSGLQPAWDDFVLASYAFWIAMALKWLSVGDQARFDRACNRAVSWLTGGTDAS